MGVASVVLSLVLLSMTTEHARAQQMDHLVCSLLRTGYFVMLDAQLPGVDVICNERSGLILTPPFAEEAAVLCMVGDVWQEVRPGSRPKMALDCYIPQSTDEVRAAAGWWFCTVLWAKQGQDVPPVPIEGIPRIRLPGENVLRCVSAQRLADLMGW
jgi:hypothetical protein